MSQSAEYQVLERLAQDLRADGYEVYLRPNKLLIPTFLGDFSPDAIALRQDKNLVVQVTGGSSQASKKLQQIVALMQGQPGWDLRVVAVGPADEQERMQVQDNDAMRARIMEVRQIAGAGHREPALLVAWATFEALARAMREKQFERPQTPGRIVQMLASDGVLTPTEADLLRALAQKRNSFIHGELQVRVSAAELERFAAVLEAMLKRVPLRKTGKAA